MVVLKFGGTSVGESDGRRRVLEIVEAEPRPRVVVVSALSGVTDALLQMAAAGGTPESLRALDALLNRHLAAARMLHAGPSRTRLEEDLRRIGAQVSIVLRDSAGALTSRSCDEVVAAGELWSSRLLAALLQDRGTPAEWIDARQVVRTNSEHGAAAPDLDATRAAVARLIVPVVSTGSIAVLGGFLGSDPRGTTTTLGRGGSDYSAALLGACLDAEEIQIWTDVDGVLTADPRILPHARLVAHLSYGEAHDLAFFGAKVLHPGTITPAVQRNIPVIVRNSHRPAGPGTLVTERDRIDRARGVVAGLACRDGVTLVEATACEGSEVSAVTSRLFEALQEIRVGEVVLAEQCGDRLAVTIQKHSRQRTASRFSRQRPEGGAGWGGRRHGPHGVGHGRGGRRRRDITARSFCGSGRGPARRAGASHGAPGRRPDPRVRGGRRERCHRVGAPARLHLRAPHRAPRGIA